MMLKAITSLAALAIPTALFAQAVAGPTTQATLDVPYQINYASNLNLGDGVINVTNSGASAGANVPIEGPTGLGNSYGDICVNVYVYAPDEELAACCTCLVSPNSLHAFADSFGTGNLLSASPLSAAAALANIRQTNSMVIKLLATLPAGVGGAATSSLTCQNPATPGALASGMIAWGTHSHPTNTTQAAITETPFAPATLSPGEYGKLTGECRALQTTASGTQCPGCIVGGLAAPSTVL